MPPVSSAAHRHRAGLRLALALGAGVLVLEIGAGLAANSIALLADAGHVLADVSGMALSAIAIRLANRGPSAGRTFGLYRLEIVAAALNALLLLVIAAIVTWEGAQRLTAPGEVRPDLMMAVAAVALVGNAVAIRALRAGQAASLTLRAAYLEVLGDTAGAVAVLVAGVVISLTGFRGADGLAAIGIGLLILPRTWRVLRESLDILLEANPRDVDTSEVRRHILEAPGVKAVHDLHAWAITSGMNVVSAHVVVDPNADTGRLIDHLSDCLAGDFDIDHSTFQLETPEHAVWEARAARAQH